LGSHPVYDYLVAGYGLDLLSVHWEPGEEPSYTQWQSLQKVLADHKAETMLWEGPPMAQTEATLKSMNVESVVFDPCGNRPVNGDFLGVMQRNVENLAKIYD
jgi:zinc transport system substrate-binding protein